MNLCYACYLSYVQLFTLVLVIFDMLPMLYVCTLHSNATSTMCISYGGACLNITLYAFYNILCDGFARIWRISHNRMESLSELS
jgi:hypothetical protein